MKKIEMKKIEMPTNYGNISGINLAKFIPSEIEQLVTTTNKVIEHLNTEKAAHINDMADLMAEIKALKEERDRLIDALVAAENFMHTFRVDYEGHGNQFGYDRFDEWIVGTNTSVNDYEYKTGRRIIYRKWCKKCKDYTEYDSEGCCVCSESVATIKGEE